MFVGDVLKRQNEVFDSIDELVYDDVTMGFSEIEYNKLKKYV